MNDSKRGFTIVELLIVIVVIAILASISIVAYNGIQSRAHDAAIKSDFHHILTKLEIHKVINGSYPHDADGNPTASGSCDGASGTVIKPALESIDMKLSTGSYNTSTANTNLLYVASNDGERFALLGYAVGNPTYYVTNQQTTVEIYEGNGTSQSNYPGGTPCGIADNLGVSSLLTNGDFGFYYIYTQSSGGFRICN